MAWNRRVIDEAGVQRRFRGARSGSGGARATVFCRGRGARVRQWKLGLPSLADEPGLTITVCHLPPGSSRWTKIEPWQFASITRNWRAKPLVGDQAIVQLIAASSTRTGLSVKSVVNPASNPAGAKMRGAEMAPHAFHGKCNHSIAPKSI
jgi:hypothetical protein